MSALPACCVCCGGTEFAQTGVLWPELVAAWGLSAQETAAMDAQQGRHCTRCGCNLRSMVLARAIARAFGEDEPFDAFVASETAQRLRVLEMNEAGNLTPFLARLPLHRLVRFPEIDMTALPFADGSFDLICHSDTLEHVAQPVEALRECRRVLAPRGVLAFTVPLVPNRPTRRRAGLPPSYHGTREERSPDFLVHTEYGDDAWHDVIEAGFDECRIVGLAAPVAFAMVATRSDLP